MKRALLLLFLPALALSQTSMTFRAGALSCGLIRRTATQIQFYCYAPTYPTLGWKIVENNAFETTGFGEVKSFQWGGLDSTGKQVRALVSFQTWQTNPTGGIPYDVSGWNGVEPIPPRISGTLSSP